MTRSWWFAALLSVLLHLLVAVPLILRPSWLFDAPEPPPPVYAQVDLVVQDTPTVGEGSGRPVLHDTAPTPPPAQTATPPLPPTPDPSAEPVPAPPSVAAQPAPPVPAEPPKDPGPPPAIRLGDGDDAGTGIVTGPGVIPAQPGKGMPVPPYPEEAARLGQHGTVALIAHIDTQGRPESVDLVESSGWPLLDKAALNAVKHWKFHPALRDGVPVPSTYPINMNFRTDENTP